jgi:hypothetical protein
MAVKIKSLKNNTLQEVFTPLQAEGQVLSILSPGFLINLFQSKCHLYKFLP